MAFDWKRFFRAHQINYVESGPNWSRGRVNVQCPFCGSADRSEHMSISLKGEGWVCRRVRSHSGKSRVRLVAALLRIDNAEAARLVGGGEEAEAPPRDEDIGSLVRRNLGMDGPNPASTASTGARLELFKEFRPLKTGDRWAAPFLTYLRERGYSRTNLDWVIETYELHYAVTGDFKYRVIFPIRDFRRSLLSWTGRSIRADAIPRYKTLTLKFDGERPDAPLALAPVNDLLLGLPFLAYVPAPRGLILCEGPFDAVKLTAFGRSYGVYATSLFGLNVSISQVGLIRELAGRFPSIWLLLDTDAAFHRLRILTALEGLNVRSIELPSGVKDPGDLTGLEAIDLLQNLIN